jgi:hypothetical protein
MAVTQTATVTLTLTIVGPLTITTTTLPVGVQGQAYPATQLSATGGTPPYTWAASGLPPGMVLSQTGLLSGMPTSSGAFNVVVAVSDVGS